MKKLLTGIMLTAAALILTGSVHAVSNPTPSTNDANKGKGWAYAEQISKGVGTTDMKFKSTRNFMSCFEYRTDGDTTQKTSDTNYNTEIKDGLYPYVCVKNQEKTKTITAKEYVEVRMVFGAEKDERFGWTKFDVLPEPTCEEQKANGTWAGEHECGWSPKPWTPGPYSPAVCGGIYPTTPLLQRGVRVNDTTINLGWWPVGNASKYSLVYGYTGEAMMHGIASIDRGVTGLNVSSLRPNTATQFELWAWNGECVSKSKVLVTP